MKQLLILICFITLFSCTENTRARAFGGTTTVDLPKGYKLVNVTWKETDLWYLTTLMDSTDKPRTYNFDESSTYGMMEGRVIFKESK